MNNKKAVLGLIFAATAGVFVLTRAKNAPPSDLRDAVAADVQSPELNTAIPVFNTDNKTLPVPEKPSAVPANNPLKNFGIVSPQDADHRGNVHEGVIYRGGSLNNEAAYAFLHGLGVSAVASLQKIHSADQALCAKYGMTCRDFGMIPLDWISLANNSSFQKAFSFVLAQRKAGHKVYIHCLKGKDRTEALAAALIIREQGCGGNFDKARVRATVEESVHAYNLTLYNFPKWHAEILGWVDNFEGNKNWLCK